MSSKNKIDFIGIGAPRCATTWLTDCLIEHPEICFPYTKELNYFSRTRANKSKSEYEINGILGYLAIFNKCRDKIKGEFSTYYLIDSNVASIIKKHFPHVKIVVSLRNPVDRAYSDYCNVKNIALNEKENFKEAFYKKGMGLDSYKNRGFYFKQLKRYFKLFPKKKIHIILYDDIVELPEEVIKKLYKFLGVDHKFIPPSLYKKETTKKTRFIFIRDLINILRRIYNYLENAGLEKTLSKIKRKTKFNKLFNKINEYNRKKTNKEELDVRLKNELTKIYRKDIQKLERLINRKLDKWY